MRAEIPMTSQQPSPDGTSADHSRSGADIAEAIEVAERGSAVEEVHDQGTENTSGEAPVERSAGDPEMTEGQVVHGGDAPGTGAGGAAEGTTPAPTESSSGVAQSVVGGRTSDRVASGDESGAD
jgi:hypothetical protein